MADCVNDALEGIAFALACVSEMLHLKPHREKGEPHSRGSSLVPVGIGQEGHREDPKVKKALAELEQHCKFLKVLGSYLLGE